jgi:hypothetical protein
MNTFKRYRVRKSHISALLGIFEKTKHLMRFQRKFIEKRTVYQFVILSIGYSTESGSWNSLCVSTGREKRADIIWFVGFLNEVIRRMFPIVFEGSIEPARSVIVRWLSLDSPWTRILDQARIFSYISWNLSDLTKESFWRKNKCLSMWQFCLVFNSIAKLHQCDSLCITRTLIPKLTSWMISIYKIDNEFWTCESSSKISNWSTFAKVMICDLHCLFNLCMGLW